MIRLTISLRAGDHSAAATAAAQAEILVRKVPGDMLARHPEIRAHVLFGHGAADLWLGRLDEAAHVLDLAVGAATGSGGSANQPTVSGHLALVEALRGQLRHAAKLAAQATAGQADQQPPARRPNPAALVALTWVHLERNELRETHRRLKEADSAWGIANPDKLISTVACLTAAGAALADGRAAAAVQIIAGARSKWSPPAWLDHRLSLTASQAHAIAGDLRTEHWPQPSTATWRRLAGGGGRNRTRMDGRRKPAQCTTGARARIGDRKSGARTGAAARAWLVDAPAQLQQRRRRARPSILLPRCGWPSASNLQAVRHGTKLWMDPVLKRDPVLAGAHQRLFAPAPRPTQLPGPGGPPRSGHGATDPATHRTRAGGTWRQLTRLR